MKEKNGAPFPKLFLAFLLSVSVLSTKPVIRMADIRRLEGRVPGHKAIINTK